jgi:tetratricopeptide (TPR) repeat protein
MVKCGNPSATDADLARYVNVILAAIGDVERGTELARTQNFALDKNVGYYYRQLGQLAYILYTCKGQNPVARLEQAIAYYGKAIAADPSNADYFQFRGRITYVLGLKQPKDPAGQQHRLEDYQRALADLSLSLTLSQDNHEALYWRGLVNTGLADLQSTQDRDDLARREEYLTDALTDTQRALALAPDEGTRADYATALASIYLKLGWTYYLQDRYKSAVEATDQGLQFDANQPLLYFVKGLAELVMGDSHAQRTYQAGIEAARRLDDTERRRAALDEAIQDLHNLLDKTPNLRDAADPILKVLEAAKP